MAKEVRLPQLGQTMEEGTIIECMVKIGDQVKKGDIIFEIETDKATLEMESPADGFVKKILIEVDQTLPVGEPLLILGKKDEEISQDLINSLKQKPQIESGSETAAVVPEPKPAELQGPKKTAEKVFASPRAKRLAKELSVELSSVTGTGSGGKITEEDVKIAVEQSASLAGSIDKLKLGMSFRINKLQQLTAQRMRNSKLEIPCFYLSVKIDVTKLVQKRADMNEKQGMKISYNDFLIKAFSSGIEKFPLMAGQLTGDVITLADTINIGLAVEAPNGLVVPVIKDVQTKDLNHIASETQKLIEKAKQGKLSLADLEGACITISSLGAYGIDSFIPIVIPGQCSIVGIGQIIDDCVPNNNDVEIRKMMNMNLSVDHKVVNGAYASQFLDFVKKLLSNPG